MVVESKGVSGFPDRLREACGSDKPAQIAQKLGVPYQTIKNYLAGRLPAADVLVQIATSTNVSIHWLLTGEGPKNVDRDGDLANLDKGGKPGPKDREMVESLLAALKKSLKSEAGFGMSELPQLPPRDDSKLPDWLNTRVVLVALVGFVALAFLVGGIRSWSEEKPVSEIPTPTPSYSSQSVSSPGVL